MKNKEKKTLADIVARQMPFEHNRKLIEKVVNMTVELMENRSWWKRLFKK